MTSNHFYLATISFTFGVLVATLYLPTLPVLLWLMLWAVVCALLWRKAKNLNWLTNTFLLTGLALVFFVLGAVRVLFYENSFGHSALEVSLGQTVELSGVIIREPERRENSTQLYVKAGEDVLLVSVDRYTDVSYGDLISVSGKLERPETFTTDLGRTFNYPGYLLAKGVEYKISFADVVGSKRGEGNFLIAYLLNLKTSFLKNISELIPEPAAGLGAGLLLGVKQALGEELEDAFRQTGIIHIVVLSGYNVMLVVIFVMYILGYFLREKPRVIVGLLAITTFAFLVGLSATVLRACLMAALLLVAQVTGRTYLVLRGLMLAGVVMLIFNPFLLVYDIGFQLSFLATMGLILISPHFDNWLKIVPGTIGIRGFLVATISTQIAVMPLLLYQIGQFSVVSVVVNVLVLPMVPVAMLLTFITGLSAYLSTTLAFLLAIPTYWSLSYINHIALWFAELPFASYVVPSFPFYLVPLCYLIIGYILWRFYRPSFIENGFSEKGKVVKVPEFNLDGWTIKEEFDNKPELKNLG